MLPACIAQFFAFWVCLITSPLASAAAGTSARPSSAPHAYVRFLVMVFPSFASRFADQRSKNYIPPSGKVNEHRRHARASAPRLFRKRTVEEARCSLHARGEESSVVACSHAFLAAARFSAAWCSP